MSERLQEQEALLERMRAENDMLRTQLESATMRLEAANHELESFSYSVSHDLRAPLRAINGNAMILEEDFADQFGEGMEKYVKRIRDNAVRLEALINDLLLFSRIGRKEVRKSPIDMNALVAAIFERLAQDQPHSARVEVQPLPEGSGDYSLLERAWSNLISNAVKFSSKKPEPVVHVGAETADGIVTYYVRDNGAGFDMAYADKLFGTFQRLHDVTEFEGVGMGLAIAQRIILKHGGSIRAEAAPEQGATFWFSLGR